MRVCRLMCRSGVLLLACTSAWRTGFGRAHLASARSEMHGMQANVNWALPDRVMHAVGECFAVRTCVAKRNGSPEQRPCAGACASDGCFRMFTGLLPAE